MSDASQLIAIIERSTRLDHDLRRALEGTPLPQTLRGRAALGWATASLEHGRGLRSLMLQGNECASFALLRPQMEAFVRQVWVGLVPDDAWLEEFFDLKDGDNREPKEPPSISNAVSQLDAMGLQPFAGVVKGLLDMLGDAHHSYTHNGARAVQMALQGANANASLELVKLSNAFVLNSAAQLLKFCAPEAGKIPDLHGIAAHYHDCFLGAGPPGAPAGVD